MAQHMGPEERRSQVSDALFTVIAHKGLEKTTIRDVAEEAGVSVGLVQRYFRTKDDLLRFGIQVVYERVEDHINNVTVALPVRSILDDIITPLLPLDEQREREFRVAFAFWHASLHDPEMSTTHREATNRLIDAFIEVISGAQRAGEIHSSINPELEARILMALIDGLAMHATITPDVFSPADVVDAVTTHLNRIFTGPGGETTWS